MKSTQSFYDGQGQLLFLDSLKDLLASSNKISLLFDYQPSIMRKKSGWKSFNFYSKRNFKRISVNFCLTVDVRRPDVGTNYSGPAAVRRSGRFRNERLFEWWLPISTTCQLPRRAVSTFLLRWRTPIRLLSKVTLSALSDHQMTSGSLLQ